MIANRSGQPGAVLSSRRAENTGVVRLCAVLGAAAGAAAAGSPTGLPVWDRFLQGGLTLLVVLAAAQGPRWVPIVLASAAAAAVGLSPWVIPAWAALLIAVAQIRLTRRHRILAALSAAVSMQVLLRLPPFGFFGLPSIVAGLAVAVVLTFGYRYASRTTRKWVRGIALVTVILGLVVAVASLILVRSTSTQVEQGMASARLGLEAVRGGEVAAAIEQLDETEASLSAAQATASGVLMQPLRLIPIAAQHRSALVGATEQGAIVAEAARSAVTEVPVQSMTLVEGAVDIEALQRLAPQLRTTADSLRAVPGRLAEVNSPWLVPTASRRIDELAAELEELVPEADLAAQAATVLPGLLGANGESTYFVLLGTPAESREFGGFVGSYAIIRFNNGQLELLEANRINELYGLSSSNVLVGDDLPVWYERMANPTSFPQNLTSSPSFPTIAFAAQQVFDGHSFGPFDGFVYMDTWAVAQTVELSGPIETELDGALLAPSTAAQLLLYDQYRLPVDDRREIFDELASVASRVLTQLDEVGTATPDELGRVLGPMARAGRIQMVTNDEENNDFLRSVKLLRDFDAGSARDFVGLVQTNSVESKLDLYLHRDVSYDMTVAPDGAVNGIATVVLESIIPDDAPPVTLGRGDGTARPLMSLYTPHRVDEVRINGAVVPFAVSAEFGFQRFLVEVPVPPTGEPVTVEYELSGRMDPTLPYDLKVWHQPLVNNDQMRVSYSGPDADFAHSVELVENMIFSSVGAVQE